MKYTVKDKYCFEEKIKKSTFIGNLIHIESLQQARDFIHEINKLHPQANHNCPAYILGKNGDIPFSSDAGEPSGTAGKPILNVLQKHELSNVCLVVTRYFGGIKLGVRGLIDAYSYIADKTIELGHKTPIIDYFYYECQMSYDYYNIFLHKTQAFELEILDTIFTEYVIIKIMVSEYINNDFNDFITDLQNSGKLKLLSFYEIDKV